MRRILTLSMAAQASATTTLIPVVTQGQAHKPPAKPSARMQMLPPPKAVYWLSAQTMTGVGLGGNMPSPGRTQSRWPSD